MNLAMTNQTANERVRLGHIGELISASAVRLSTASASAPGMRSMPFRFQVDKLLRQQAELERDYEALRQRYESMGQLTRPRWGYMRNVEEYNRGASPPGACPVSPRGMALREGTRWKYQPGRSENVEGIFIPILIGGSLLASLGAWAWKHHEETAEVENRVKVYEDLVKSGIGEEEAARLAFGGGGDVSGILSKMVLLGAMGLGAYILVKLWR